MFIYLPSPTTALDCPPDQLWQVEAPHHLSLCNPAPRPYTGPPPPSAAPTPTPSTTKALDFPPDQLQRVGAAPRCAQQQQQQARDSGRLLPLDVAHPQYETQQRADFPGRTQREARAVPPSGGKITSPAGEGEMTAKLWSKCWLRASTAHVCGGRQQLGVTQRLMRATEGHAGQKGRGWPVGRKGRGWPPAPRSSKKRLQRLVWPVMMCRHGARCAPPPGPPAPPAHTHNATGTFALLDRHAGYNIITGGSTLANNTFEHWDGRDYRRHR